MSQTPIHDFILKNYQSFNSRALKNSYLSYLEHLQGGGKMFWTMAGAMSSAQIGIAMAPAIKNDLIHGLSVTGANLEESLFRLVAHNHYENFDDYRYFTKEDDTKILEKGQRRVTDMSIPEEEAFRKIEHLLLPIWRRAQEQSTTMFWHEYFYELIKQIPESLYVLEASRKNLPIVVPGFEDSTFGNIFASYVKKGIIKSSIVKSGIDYMVWFYDVYQNLSEGKGLGFFQIGGGISGDFPICVVPSIKYDLEHEVKPWAYFCQISDSTTSYGSYSGATPNEKITWDKLTKDTPMFVIESDATIVVPLILQALLEQIEIKNLG